MYVWVLYNYSDHITHQTAPRSHRLYTSQQVAIESLTHTHTLPNRIFYSEYFKQLCTHTHTHTHTHTTQQNILALILHTHTHTPMAFTITISTPQLLNPSPSQTLTFSNPHLLKLSPCNGARLPEGRDGLSPDWPHVLHVRGRLGWWVRPPCSSG